MGNTPRKTAMTVTNLEITELVRDIEFEYKGKSYRVFLTWVKGCGYDPQWVDKDGKNTDEPYWLIRHDELDVYEELDELAKAHENETSLRVF